jgi:hypothetical protein
LALELLERWQRQNASSACVKSRQKKKTDRFYNTLGNMIPFDASMETNPTQRCQRSIAPSSKPHCGSWSLEELWAPKPKPDGSNSDGGGNSGDQQWKKP